MTSDELSLRAYLRQADAHTSGGGTLEVGYAAPGAAIEAPLLAAITFGPQPPQLAAPLHVQVDLEPLGGTAKVEYWVARGDVTTGRAGAVRYAHDEHFLFAAIDLDESEHSGILTAAEHAYRAALEFQKQSAYPHLLRMWNFMDRINEGEGDLERYRQFCVGRARGLGEAAGDQYPAATAIGRQQPTQRLQVFWLAGRVPGIAVENPRQVSAYRYPRVYGPASPSFSRATALTDGSLLVSGTASIVGHISRHPDDPIAQTDETLRNLEVLIERAQEHRSAAAAAARLLKVYVRNPLHAEAIADRIRSAYPADEVIVLAADICRRELLLEIECVRCAGTPHASR